MTESGKSMVGVMMGRVDSLISDAKVITQALFEGRLFIEDNFLQSRIRINTLHQRNQAEYKAGLCLSEIEKGIARFHYLEPITLLRLKRCWWAIMPVWREGKPVPPLPYKGRSGRIYKPGQEIPLSEAD